MWKMAGNLDRIQELKDAGFGYNGIAGIFTDEGIPLTSEVVKSLHENAPLLQDKGLDKKVVKKLIKQKNSNPNLIEPVVIA
ncbi:hypothetical protein ENHAE0001_0831 [Enhydrobacter aerosaccus SK60]|nr:hypothetical protein ENHAE0001_0831 [Enhydrobacter aerosaccus SK60]